MLWVLLNFIFFASAKGFGTYNVSHGSRPHRCPTSAEQAAEQRKAIVREIMEESPYSAVCNKAEYFRNIPESNLFSFGYPIQDSRRTGPRQTRELLIDVHDSVVASLQQDVNVAENLLKCMDSKQGSEAKAYCDQVGASEMLENEIPNQSQQARFHLALSAPVRSHDVEVQAMNGNLISPPGVYKALPWQPLSESDKKVISEILDSYKADIRKRYSKTNGAHSNYRQLLNELKPLRTEHLRAYDMIMSRFPVLNFVREGLTARPQPPIVIQKSWPEANKREAERTNAIRRQDQLLFEAGQKKIRVALAQTIALRKKEISKLLAMRYKLVFTDNDEVLSESVNILKDWGPHVLGYLQTHPRDCGLATALALRKNKRELGVAVAIAVPLIGASIFLPPLAGAVGGTAVGVATAVGVGGVGAGVAYHQYQRAEVNLTSAKKRAAGGGITGLSRDETGAFTFEALRVAQNQAYTREVHSAEFNRDASLASVYVGVALPFASLGALKGTSLIKGVLLRSSTKVDHGALKATVAEFAKAASAASP
jgi:hypothetical protein